MKLLQNKHAIVTGGSAGIGLAIAKVFIEQGAQVAIFGMNAERGQAALSELGSNALFIPVDVSKTAAVDEAIKQVLEHFGKCDILVNNAGITRDQLLMKMSEADWDEVLNTNAKSCYNTCRAIVRTMLKAKEGKIINISSVIGLTGNPGQVNYAASKGAIIAMSKSLAQELASRNIQVNCIAPGFIETKMTALLTETQRHSIISKIPLGRIGSPEEVAHTALFLASSLSNYITGQVLVVDGGMVM